MWGIGSLGVLQLWHTYRTLKVYLYQTYCVCCPTAFPVTHLCRSGIHRLWGTKFCVVVP